MKIITSIKKIFLGVLLFVLAVLAGAYFIAATQQGLMLSCWIINCFLPGELVVTHLQGALVKQITFDQLRYRDQKTNIEINEFVLDWRWQGLLKHKWIINHVSAQSGEFHFYTDKFAANDNNNSFSIVKWLNKISIAEADIKNINIYLDQKKWLEIIALTLAHSLGNYSSLIVDAALQDKKLFINGFLENKRRSLEIQKSVIRYADAKLSMSGQISQTSHMTATLDIPNIAKFIPDYKGSLQMHFLITGNPDCLNMQSALRMNNLSINNVSIKQLNGQISGDVFCKANTLFAGKVQAGFDNKNKVDGEVYLAKNYNLSSHFNISLTQLSHLSDFLNNTRAIKNVKGQVFGNIDVTGNLFEPHLNGAIHIKQGSLNLPDTKTTLTNITLDADFIKDRMHINGYFNAASGHATVIGDLTWADQGLIALVNLKGDRLKIINTSEYKITINPNLLLNYSAKGVSIDGKINVIAADIHPVELTNVVTLPNEVVFVDKPAAHPEIPPQLTLSIELILAKDINITYQGLQSALTGRIKITQLPHNPPVATGELSTLNGTYKTYGQHLKITEGRLIYTGNLLSNPGLNIRAMKTIKVVNMGGQSAFNSNIQTYYSGSGTLAVGVWVRGTLKKPIVTLISTPARLSQADILSYLVLGYPQSQVTGSSSLALLNMAASGQDEGRLNQFTNNIQNKLGLSELSIGTTEYYNPNSNASQSSTTTNIGKNLGNNLSMHYSVGLFDPVAIYSLRYQINKYFALQTETSSLETGSDLLYQVQSDD